MTKQEAYNVTIAARRSLGNKLEHLDLQYDSSDLASVIAQAISDAIAEYDKIKTQ